MLAAWSGRDLQQAAALVDHLINNGETTLQAAKAAIAAQLLARANPQPVPEKSCPSCGAPGWRPLRVNEPDGTVLVVGICPSCRYSRPQS